MPILGTDVQTGAPVALTSDARRQGVYVIGTTGTGKTTLLKSVAVQDMADPARPGLCVIDPHGDFVDELLGLVPHHRRDDVILFAPGDDDQVERPLGFNILACNRADPRERGRVTSTVISTLYKLFSYSWGPRMEDLLRHSIETLMETPDTTLLDLLLLLSSETHRKRYTKNLTDPVLRQFWNVQFANYDRRTMVEVVGSSLNKIGRFIVDKRVRRVVSQPKNAFDLRHIMDTGKILLVNLSKGDLGEDNSALLGSVLVNAILIAAFQRREIPFAKRRPFHVIADEYQGFAISAFPTLQSEARKYAIDTIVAHQYRDQLDDLNKGSTLNVANLIVLRATGMDSQELAAQFDNTPPPPDATMQPFYRSHGTLNAVHAYVPHGDPETGQTVFREVEQPRRLYADVQAETANDLATLPNLHAWCRLVEGNRLAEHEVEIAGPLTEGDAEIAQSIRQRSLRLGRPAAEVDAEITATMQGLEFDDLRTYEDVSED